MRGPITSTDDTASRKPPGSRSIKTIRERGRDDGDGPGIVELLNPMNDKPQAKAGGSYWQQLCFLMLVDRQDLDCDMERNVSERS
jgi:hypothetical protein